MRPECENCLPTFLGVILLSVALDVIAQAYPMRPVRAVVPFPPGGAVDLYARLAQQRLSETLGQQIVIDNRSGAGGMIGAELVAKAPADGYTLMFGNIATLAMNVGVYPKMAYSPAKDFTPIMQTVVVNYVLAVNPRVPAKNVEELIAYAKANPARLSYASPGSGSAPHFAVELLKSRTGINIVHVPYKGGGPALADVIAGQVQLAVLDQGNAMPHAKNGRLRALGVGSPRRSPQYPDLPTIAESGLPGFEAGAWQGMVGPAGLNREVIARLHDALSKTMATREVRERLLDAGLDPVGSSPEAFGNYIRSEIDKWAKIAKEIGARAE